MLIRKGKKRNLSNLKENAVLNERDNDVTEITQEAGAEKELENKMEKELDNEQDNETTQQAAVDTMQQLGIDERILRAIQEMGFEKMSPIQEQAIPSLLNGKDIIGQAQTGTGKTAAFGIPVIQRIDPDNRNLQAVILCPTRELAIQASEEIRKLAKYMAGIKILPVYGGQDISRQIRGLKGVQIIVGTPGRVMDHMRRHTIKMDQVSMVVLDEADEMLNMGFREDMELILGQIENKHQTALFSATMPKPILEITKNFQANDAALIKVAAKELTIPLVKQTCYRVNGRDKMAACERLLEYHQPKLTLIFCNTKKMVDDLAERLKKKGYQAEGLHGDLSQNQRDTVMNRFRNGAASILIATDVAARGIDVDDVEAVINFDIPQDIEYYVHRIGRTGRAGRSGKAFTLLSGRESYRIRDIERVCKTTIEEKKLPTAAEATRAKARKVLSDVCKVREDYDLSQMTALIERKMEKESCTASEIAAAFLKFYMGDDLRDIPEEERNIRRFHGREDNTGRRRSDSNGRSYQGRRTDERGADQRKSGGSDSRRGGGRSRYENSRGTGSERYREGGSESSMKSRGGKNSRNNRKSG